MNIAIFAKRSGVSAHTLRYYEKIGLMPPIARNTSGHRDFNENDLDWIAFVNRLKQTGMPLNQIRHYADLRAQGDDTVKARKELLQAHADDLEQRLEAEFRHLAKIQEKICYYETL